jgi:hypothetical protein
MACRFDALSDPVAALEQTLRESLGKKSFQNTVTGIS